MPKVHTSYPIWLPCDKGELSPYKVSHSGTESAVVLQCLMLLAAFLTPFGRDFSEFCSPLGGLQSYCSLHSNFLIYFVLNTS